MARWFLLCKSWSTPCVRCTIWQCARVIVRTLLEYMNHDFWLYSPSRNPKAQTTNGSRAPYKFHESNYSFHYNLDGKLFSSSKSVKEKKKIILLNMLWTLWLLMDDNYGLENLARTWSTIKFTYEQVLTIDAVVSSPFFSVFMIMVELN